MPVALFYGYMIVTGVCVALTTLVKGEMIIDMIPDSGLKRGYLAYDLMALDSVSQTR